MTIQNAKAFLNIQKEFGSFDFYLWLNHKPIKNKWTTIAEVPAKTELSGRLAKDLKNAGLILWIQQCFTHFCKP